MAKKVRGLLPKIRKERLHHSTSRLPPRRVEMKDRRG